MLYQLDLLKKWWFKNLSVRSLKWNNNTVSINLGIALVFLRLWKNVVTDWRNSRSCNNSIKGSRTGNGKSPVCWKCMCFILKCSTCNASTLSLHSKHQLFLLAFCAPHSHWNVLNAGSMFVSRKNCPKNTNTRRLFSLRDTVAANFWGVVNTTYTECEAHCLFYVLIRTTYPYWICK